MIANLLLIKLDVDCDVRIAYHGLVCVVRESLRISELSGFPKTCLISDTMAIGWMPAFRNTSHILQQILWKVHL